jgi:hypothetical protein
MRLSETSIRRPVLATVMSLLLILIGLVSFKQLSVREYPRIDEPLVTVSTRLLGASSEVIESQVTKPLEDSIAGIDGVDIITSISRTEQSQITVRFKPDQGPGHRRGRGARPRRPGARPPARCRRRARDRQGRGRRHADHLAGLHQRDDVAAGAHRPHQPRRQAAAADHARRGRRADRRRPQVRDAHLARPRQAGRLPADGAGRRGRAAAAEPRGAGRPHREPAARIQRHLAHRPEHGGAVQRDRAQDRQRLRRAPARRGAGRGGGGQRTLARAPERRAVDLHRRDPQCHRQPAGGGRRRACR